MGILMERRLTGLLALAATAWLLGGATPLTCMGLKAATLGYGAWYAFLLFKTFTAIVLGPYVWGYVAMLVVVRDLSKHEFFRADAAPEEIVQKREAALKRLEEGWQKRFSKSLEHQTLLRRHFSDLRFKASGFESTFPIFQKVVYDALDPCTLVESTESNEIVDIQGNKFLDVSGSYGVNCFGYARTKEFLREGQKLADKIGPCLGPMHPVVVDNIQMLLKIFRKEELSFHMSGTEAVMSAVYQARFHTGRRLTAVFAGAYHGWWDGVMQGAGNDRFAGDCLILKDQSPESLALLQLRAAEVAAVIVNPINGFAWKNAGTAGMATAPASKVTAGPDSIEKFRVWLCQLRETCTRSQIPLIFDETWAFQLGPGGAQELYGVEADLLVLGKGLGGGHACGAVLGPSRLMERRDPERPMRVNFVVGTFKGNPVVMGAMNAVLKWVTTTEAATTFNGLKDRVAKWVDTCNAALSKQDLPISVAAFKSTWCIKYHQPSVYQFLFQYYLRDAGMVMAWVGTSKMLFNLEFGDADLKRLTEILITAATAFKADGWWHEGARPLKVPQLLPLVVGPTLSYHCKTLRSWLGL